MTVQDESHMVKSSSRGNSHVEGNLPLHLCFRKVLELFTQIYMKAAKDTELPSARLIFAYV